MDKELLDILACPACKGKLEARTEALDCGKCRKSYPIRAGIPILLIEEAAELSK